MGRAKVAEVAWFPGGGTGRHVVIIVTSFCLMFRIVVVLSAAKVPQVAKFRSSAEALING